MANPNWSDWQCLLAIWAYHQMDADSSVVKSNLYRTVSRLTGRGEDAVSYKVANVADCDARPREQKPIRAGLPRKQGRLQELFDEYFAHRRTELDEIYEQAESFWEQGLALPDTPVMPHRSPTKQASRPRKPVYLVEEGARTPYSGDRRKRSAQLTTAARLHHRSNSLDGMLRCAVCNITFDHLCLGAEVMHIHHLHPLSETDADGNVLPLAEALQGVRPVCPTCHSLIHTRKPCLTVGEAKDVWAQIHTSDAQVLCVK